ncbi:ribosomal protein S12 methylthiotransferase accessory factor [Kushneria sinocarnis]|uniref:Ribosomal protein S12 methylthiotransferase accessory factor n=1 Tax=Kushneria sinocarnis TaxID=595502 RepID=A0A420WYE7_9GAMM|nr:30S ribosomal protein S12 methylthiotransferase accessory factor YcaO [Kushneria sinocarnis]RKR06249.1 ribosomal protein S12 methylthiotransferase accessory factor [Kushneria sinocarnis]
MTQTWIPGKDEALEASIDRLHHCVSELGFHIEEGRWLNPAPHVWSVHIRDRECPQVFANGKGSTHQAALASAYGELLERLSTRYLWADFYLTPVLKRFGFIHQSDEIWFDTSQRDEHAWPEALLDDHTLNHFDPERELTLGELQDLNGGDSGHGVCALPYSRISDGRQVLIPVNIIGNLFVSNGMSAGNNRDEALVQGLSEIFERGIKNRIISDAITLPEVPASVLERYPGIQAGMSALEAAGFTLRALDGSLGGRYPVMCIVLQNPADGGVYASFGAHPRFGVALERAMTELLQGRALDELEGFPAPTTDMDLVNEPYNLELHFIDSSGYVSWALLGDRPDVAFHDWDDPRDNAATKQALIDLLAEDGHEVYVAEHTALGAYACRILVPGFSEVYPADELKWHNNNQALSHRATLFNLPSAGHHAWQQLLETLEHHGVNEQLRVLEWAGIVGDPGTSWARLRIGELKLWLMLALEDTEGAMAQLSMILGSGHLSLDERTRLRALEDVLSLLNADADLEEFRRALNVYHGEALVEEAEELAQAQVLFPSLPALDPRSPTVAHGRLLEAYEKVLHGQRWSGRIHPAGRPS